MDVDRERPVRLFGYWRSSATWRVRIALHLKGVPFEVVPVHLVRAGGEQRAAEHRARNPLGQVPVLEVVVDGRPALLTQSLAILDFLEAVWPAPALFPKDPLARARALALAEVVNSGIQPLQNLGVGRRVEALGGDAAVWNREVIGEGLAALEAMAASTAGRFLVGDAVSVADCCLVPQLYNARRLGVDLASMPTLCRVEAACSELEAFARARPEVQVDAVG